MADAETLDGRSQVRRRAGLRLWLSAAWLGTLCILALFAPWIAPKDPLAQDLFLGRMPPAWVAGAEPGYWLGTDSLGRDVLSRIIHGARVALSVALIAGAITCVIGATLGLLAGFLRGWVDLLISRLIDIWMAFPPVLFSILLIAVLGPGLWSIILAIVVIDWTRFARVVRAEAMAQGAMDYVASARVDAEARARDLLTEVQIAEPERVMRAYPHELSGGMRQRILIASAFAAEPKLIVADEPTTALDVTVQKQILKLISQMQARHGTALLFVTHDLGVVSKVCQRLSVLYAGMVVEDSMVGDFFAAPRHPYSAALLAATPKYTDPQAGLNPVPDSVIAAVRAEVAAFDRSAAHG